MRPLLLLVLAAAAAALAAASSASPSSHHRPPISAGFIQPRAAAAPPPSSPGPRPSLSAAASAPATDTPVEGEEELVFQRWFRGRFDNARQVAEERAQGMAPGEGGGHEQIHCVLEPLPNLRPGSLGGGERFLGKWTGGNG